MANAISSVITNNVVTSFSIHEPEKFNKLFRQYGKQHLSYFAFLKTLGFISPVSRTTYSHFLEDWIHASFKSSGTPSGGGAGAAVTIALSVANGDVDSGNSNAIYPQVGDQVMNAAGVTGIITAINDLGTTTPDLVIYPDDVTANFLTGIVDGSTVVIYASRYGEGTAAPDGRVSKATEETFNTKILKEAVEVTGTELSQQIYVDGMSDGSSTGQTWYALKGQYDAQYRIQLKIGGSLLFDQSITNSAAHANSTDNNTTGLDTWITAGGNSSTYTSGAFSLSDFDYMSRVLDKYDAPMDFAFFQGINLYQDVENSLSNLFTQNPIIYVNGVGKTYNQAIYGQNPAENEGMGVDIGFRCLKKTNRLYHMVRLGELSNPQTFNAAGFNKVGLGYVCPLDTKDVKTPDGGSKAIPRIGMRYLVSPDKKQNRMMQTVMTGAQAPVPTNDTDKLKVSFLTEFGSQMFGSKHFFKWSQA